MKACTCLFSVFCFSVFQNLLTAAVHSYWYSWSVELHDYVGTVLLYMPLPLRFVVSAKTHQTFKTAGRDNKISTIETTSPGFIHIKLQQLYEKSGKM